MERLSYEERNFGGMNSTGKVSYLTKEETLGLKGYLCLCVLIHHIYQFTGWFINSYFGHFLNLLGEWAVAAFLFMSGYGLYVSYRKKGNQYLSTFFAKRVLPLYVKYAIFVLIYWVFDFKSIDNPWSVVKSFIWGGTIVNFGWYFQMLFALYLIFYFAFRVVKSSRIRSFVLLVLCVAYSIISDKAGLQHTSLPSFLFGIVFAVHKKDLDALLEKRKADILGMLISFIVFFSVYMIYVQGTIMGKFQIPNNVWAIISAISDFAIVVFIVCLIFLCHDSKLILFDNKIIRTVGIFSLEVYALQGLILRKMFPLFDRRGIYVLCCLLIIAISSFILHKIFEKILFLFR